jgi:hypothetical protein
MATPANPTFSCDPEGKNNEKYVPPELCVGQLTISTGDCAEGDSKFIEALGAEALSIAAGPINIFPLLGVHNQGDTIDVTGEGYEISGGTLAGFNAADAFNANVGSWKSSQQGINVITDPAYIGYDFGTEKTRMPNPDVTIDRYNPPAPIKKQIRTLKIKQSDEATSRAAQIRVEVSNDGINWLRADVINLINTNDLVTYSVKQSSLYRMWRLIPTMFNGITANASWEITEIQMLEDNQLSLTDIQDSVLMENRDRAYSQTSVCMKAQYDLMDVQTELSRFGIDLPQQYIFTVSFAMMVKALGRPIIIGDIVEVPGEIQYDTQLNPVRKWLEVTDTSWSTEGYTPNWKPTLYRFFANPILPSSSHRDILGTPEDRFAQSDDDFLSGQFHLNVQAHESQEDIIQQATEAVPERGSDGLQLASGTPIHHDKGRTDQKDLYVEDGMPPNGLPYTEGPDFPTPGSQADGDYHRIYYPQDLKIPARLFQWSAVKNRWIFKEQDRRGTYESYRPTLSKMLNSPNSTPINGDSQ